MMRKGTAVAGGVLVLAAAMASSASAYPSSVSDQYTIGTVYGPCAVYVSARAEAAPAAIGQLTGTESVHCESLSITPWRIYLSGEFSSSLDQFHLLSADEPLHSCQEQKACYSSRSETLFPPGDHYVNHRVEVDVAPYAVGQTYLSFPAGCRVSASDAGRLMCDFRQWVTMPAPSP